MWHVALLLAIATLASCHDTPEYADNPKGNFEALWAALDEHYCFFEHKNVDWQAIGEQYRQKIADGMTDEELLGVIGHEIGHIAHRDSKKGFRTALLTSALKDGISSKGGKAAALTESQLGDLGEALVNARSPEQPWLRSLVCRRGTSV